MLRHISVRNIALIRELELDFYEGLTVLTGETGAGKSLIVDSLNFILGAKADKTMVSYGAEKATVEAVFALRPEVAELIKSAGFDCEDQELLISRTMTSEGRGDTRINGRIATTTVLKSLTAYIADIHGQHEHQSLLRPDTHIRLLDTFGGKTVEEAKQPIDRLVNEYRDIKRQLDEIGGSDAERARAEDMLKFQIDEIESAGVSAVEDDALQQKYYIATNAEKLAEGLTSALRCLNGGGEYLGQLAHAAPEIETLTKFDARFETLSARVNSAYLELDDVFQDIDSYLDDHKIDSGEIDAIITRMEEYKRLKRKYGASVSDIIRFLESAKKKYDDLINSAALRENLQTELNRILREYNEKADILTKIRSSKAIELQRLVLRELAELGMNGSEFECRISSSNNAEPQKNGADLIEFYLSTNKGEPSKPLSKIISGGEMSRFMLALKVIAADQDGIDTIVFDEIDTGISGKVGEAIAQKMAKLALSHQILCISHLPTIAAMADHHYLIQKDEINDKTVTTVSCLTRPEMIQEIMRMIGGSDSASTHGTLHSEEMKTGSDRYKQQLLLTTKSASD